MRKELIKALDYPRRRVLELVDQRNCPHDSRFEAASERCHECDLNSECHWLKCLIEFADFEGKATHTINASVKYGIDLVETLHAELQHDTTICVCEACVWIRDSGKLSTAFEERFALNRYRQLF